MIYLPILGALALGIGTIFQKKILGRKKLGVKTYLNAEFIAITLVMLPLIYFFWNLSSEAFNSGNIFIFILVVLFSIVANLFTVYSMKWEKISNIEPAKIMEPLFVILLAILFSFIIDGNLFERNFNVIIPAIIAGLALIFSHIKKHHLYFNKFFIAAILGSFFFALELVLSRLILDFYSPITFYFLRSLAIVIIGLIIFKPNFKEINSKLKYQMLALGIIWVFYRVIVYYGYIHLGVIFTTLIVMLGPIFVYLLAWKFLKEKINWKNIIASIIIIGCVLYVILS